LQIGSVLKKLFNDGVVKREDLWITSKLCAVNNGIGIGIFRYRFVGSVFAVSDGFLKPWFQLNELINDAGRKIVL
jgi:hypothetical protein